MFYKLCVLVCLQGDAAWRDQHVAQHQQPAGGVHGANHEEVGQGEPRLVTIVTTHGVNQGW